MENEHTLNICFTILTTVYSGFVIGKGIGVVFAEKQTCAVVTHGVCPWHLVRHGGKQEVQTPRDNAVVVDGDDCRDNDAGIADTYNTTLKSQHAALSVA